MTAGAMQSKAGGAAQMSGAVCPGSLIRSRWATSTFSKRAAAQFDEVVVAFGQP
jgi:hypothetical protein